MATKSKLRLGAVLDQLEAEYGPQLPSEDPVEVGLLSLLAMHAPTLATVKSRQTLREWFVNWNEMRVADPWDITNALEAGGRADTRAFAKAAIKYLDSIHSVLDRCAFDNALTDPETDLDALLKKMRWVPPAARATVRAALARDGSWSPDKDVAKLVQKMGLSPKTTSLAKVGRALAEQAGPDDRLRAHYLLTRYAHRGADEHDPLAARAKRKRAPAKKAAAKTTKKAPVKKAPTKRTAATKTAKKSVTKPAKKPAKKPAARKSSKKR